LFFGIFAEEGESGGGGGGGGETKP